MCVGSALARGFDVRRHLGTKTRYAYRLAVPGAPSVYRAPDPEGYDPVHLYLLSRHGSRWPTADRMKQINSLEQLFRDARNRDEHPWISNWTAPFADIHFSGGELHPIGADELWGLAYRLRKRFPSLSHQDYYPKRFPVVSTQVARTAASASAFTGGFFPAVPSYDPSDVAPGLNAVPPAARAAVGAGAGVHGAGVAAADVERVSNGGLEGEGIGEAAAVGDSVAMGVDAAGRPRRSLLASPILEDELDLSLRDEPAPGIKRPQAIAVSMAPKDSDPLLRFFDCCPAYAQHDEYTERWLASWMQGNWSLLVPALESRLRLPRPMSPCEVEALWQLCLLEAGLHGRRNTACSLFTPEEMLLLEWVDDVHLLETQSYGSALNYRIAGPLLADALASLKQAAEAQEGEEAPAARLLFAHCETLVPLASLMGLFQPPAPPHPDATAADLAAAVSAAAAQRHLLQLDSLEDLTVMVERLQSLNRGAVGSEDSHVCYKGKTVTRGTVPPPPGWYPMLPNDDARLYKGARIAPYGANMALVLYRRRPGAAEASGRPAHLVRLLYNEQVLPVPGCGAAGGVEGGELDCDLEHFVQLLQDKADVAALEKLCGKEGRVVGGDGGASSMYADVGGGGNGNGNGNGSAGRGRGKGKRHGVGTGLEGASREGADGAAL